MKKNNVKTNKLIDLKNPESNKFLKEIELLKKRVAWCEDYIQVNANAIRDIFKSLIRPKEVSNKNN